MEHNRQLYYYFSVWNHCVGDPLKAEIINSQNQSQMEPNKDGISIALSIDRTV